MAVGVEYGKLVSVVVPVYNVGAYLRACIDSLIGQTYQNLEIILIDDGSSDDSGAICDEYADHDERIRAFHKENGGVSVARNMGIDKASGKYLIFVDADDCIHRELIEALMSNAMADHVVVCDWTVDFSAGEKSYCNQWQARQEQVDCHDFMQLFFKDYINPPFGKLYVTSIIKENKIYFPEGKSLGEDLLFNLDYFRYAPGKYYIIHCPLYFYRENRNGSLSTSYRKDLFEVQKELFAALYRFLNDMGIWDENNQKIYFGMYWDRLYLTVKMCKAYEKGRKECHLPELLRDSIWRDVRIECGKRKLLTWKRRVKSLHLRWLQFTER